MCCHVVLLKIPKRQQALWTLPQQLTDKWRTTYLQAITETRVSVERVDYSTYSTRKTVKEMGKVNIKPKKFNLGVGQMVLQLTVLAALEGDLGLVPNTHMMAYNRSYLKFHLQCFLLPSVGSLYIYTVHLHIYWQNNRTYKIKINTSVERKKRYCA